VKSIDGVDLSQVTSLYAGAQGALWELLLGQQIHIGGMKSSMELADLAGIGRTHARRRSLLRQRRGPAVPGSLS